MTQAVDQTEVPTDADGEAAERDWLLEEVRREAEAMDVGELPRTPEEAEVYRYLRRRAQLAGEIERIQEQTAALVKQLKTKLDGLDYLYRPGAEDMDRVCRYRWHAERRPRGWYVSANIGGRTVYLHRFVTNAPRGMEVDHREHDGFDNRKSMLRVCSVGQNRRNCRKRAATSSRFKGVYFHKGSAKWMAYVRCDGVYRYLGLHREEEEAARAYDDAARSLHGDFALLNFRP